MKILFTLESSAGMEVKMKQIKGGVTAAKGFKAVCLYGRPSLI